MNPKLLLSSALLGGLVIFCWGAISHTAVPEPMTLLSNTAKVDEFLASLAPKNGVYMDGRGVFVAVNLLPGRGDKTQDLGPLLGVEFFTNVVQAGLLLLVLVQRRPTTVVGYALSGALIGTLAWVSIEVSYWNWYGISLPLLAMGIFDAAIGFFLAGLVIGWLIRKWQPA